VTRAAYRQDERLAERGGVIECLRFPAALFGAAVRLRGALYDRDWMPSARLSVPVISVGNLTAGGAGKSPMTRWLSGWLLEQGWCPGVLSRGYAARAGEAADEALELAACLPGVPHVENPDRVAGGAELERKGVDVILLDDGFQHRRLQRDLDLVLVDAMRPWGLAAPRSGGSSVRALLPRGLLREPLGALARADAVVVTRADSVPSTTLAELRAELEVHASGRPIVEARHRPLGLRRLGVQAGGGAELSDLRALEVVLLSGIGNPQAFERTVRDLGALVVEHRSRPDHHRWTAADLAGLGAKPILTTGKDAPKLAPLVEALDIQVLEVGIEVTSGRAALQALLEALPTPVARRARESLHEGLHG
jgi:tetraacyldisaccharide 4'-kinase